MNQETFDALIGQMAADAILTRALASALIGLHPHLRAAVEVQAEAAAQSEKRGLSDAQRQQFELRIEELRPLWRSVQPD